MIVVSENVGGNMHAAAQWCNKYRLGRFLRQMEFNGGNYTVVILVMNDAEHEFFQKMMKTVARKPWTMDDFKVSA